MDGYSTSVFDTWQHCPVCVDILCPLKLSALLCRLFKSNESSTSLWFDDSACLENRSFHPFVKFQWTSLCLCVTPGIFQFLPQAWRGTAPTIWRGPQISESLWQSPVFLSTETDLWTFLLVPGVCICPPRLPPPHPQYMQYHLYRTGTVYTVIYSSFHLF